MNVKVEVITPETAAAYLATSTGNRPLNRARVHQYAADMGEGAWELTHQSIAFDDDGVLVDGHHRLTAVIVAKKPVAILVTRGVASEAYSTIDVGRPRTLADSARLGRLIVAPFSLAWTICRSTSNRHGGATHNLGAAAVQALAMSSGGDLLDHVHNLLGNRNLTALNAAHRLIAMVRLHEGEDRDFISRQLFALARREYNMMTPTMQLFCRRIEMKTLARDIGNIGTLVMVSKALDHKNANLSLLKVASSEIPHIVPRVRAAMDAFLAESGHHSVFSMNKE